MIESRVNTHMSVEHADVDSHPGSCTVTVMGGAWNVASWVGIRADLLGQAP